MTTWPLVKPKITESPGRMDMKIQRNWLAGSVYCGVASDGETVG
jgi:hypothetical protein